MHASHVYLFKINVTEGG